MNYNEIVKNLRSGKLLHKGRAILVRGWQEMPNDSLTRDALDCIREMMKQIVLHENPDFDAEELEGVVEPEGRSLFDQQNVTKREEE